MTQHLSTEVAIVGAGVIGLAIAHRLAREGREVLLIDAEAPGSGASYGNAGTIADYAVMPVGSPSVLRNLPSLLFDRNSPLAIRRAALPSLMPWLLRFTRESTSARTMRNAGVIAALMADAAASWGDLATEIGGAEILQHRGALYMYERKEDFCRASADMTERRRLGVTVDLISPAELAGMEPNLPGVEGGAAFFPKALFLSDPGQMVALLAKAAVTAGARIFRGRVEGLQRQFDGVKLAGFDDAAAPFEVHAQRVVIAAGAHSKALARQAGDRVPLETERGYHVEYDMEVPLLSRPACPTSRGFYMCPMAGRLRVAGTVELGGLTAPPSPHRIARLEEGAREIFPNLPQPARNWMGFRPSMPDSVPVIGPSKGGAEVMLAFGHGHVGLTLAPITARLISEALAGRMPEGGLAGALPARF